MANTMSQLPVKQLAWFYEQYGNLDVLKYGSMDLPQISDNQVLIKVMAASLNPIDYKRRQGYVKMDSPFPTIPGYDVSGRVVKIGVKVTKFKIGDDVYGDISRHAIDHPKQWGTLAEYTAAEDDVISKKPKNLSFEEAASLPLALLTAHQAFEESKFQTGNTALVIGGSGGVGTLAIQLAKSVFHASHVSAVSSGAKEPLLKKLGADKVIDYKTTDYESISDRFDFILDCIGEEKALKLLKENGHMVIINGQVPPPARFMIVVSDGEKLASLQPYIEDGRIKPVLDPKNPFHFKSAKDAFEYLETGHVTGKVVINGFPE